MNRFANNVIGLLTCNYCSRPQEKVRYMVTSQWPFGICDECVEMCRQIIAGRKQDEEQRNGTTHKEVPTTKTI